MDILRVMICGSVDDGKSTLVGKLFHDFGHIKEDHYKTIDRASKKQGLSSQNLALFTDGLKSEVEQGITIDVAYRYLNLPTRRLIVADVPGHLQYTRNMITACSQVDAVVLMMDASAGLKEQTLRHLDVVTWMDIPRVLLCVNKMDLVNYSEEVFKERVNETKDALARLGSTATFQALPFCALEGYGIRSFNSTPLSWFKGETLFHWLQDGTKMLTHETDPLRVSIQGSLIPQDSASVSERRFMAVIHSGVLSEGQHLTSADGQKPFTISKLWNGSDEVKRALPHDPIVFRAKESVDLPAGELQFAEKRPPAISKRFKTEVFNLSGISFKTGDRFLLRSLLSERLAIVEALDSEIKPNDRGTLTLKLQRELAADLKTRLAHSDASQFILITPQDGHTVAAGFFMEPILENPS